MKALVIKTDGTQELIEIDQKIKPLQDAVGGYIESVLHTDDWIMYANEDGLRLQLPLNRKASALVMSTCEIVGRPVPWGADRLVGNVVIVGSDDSEDNVPIPDQWVEQFKAMDLWADDHV